MRLRSILDVQPRQGLRVSLLATLVLVGCSDDRKTNPRNSDSVAPGAIQNLSAVAVSDHSVELRWTAPGDDEYAGKAADYQIRLSSSPLSEENWDSATELPSSPAPAVSGQSEQFIVPGLTRGTWHFAVRALDEVDNRSRLSNLAQASVGDSLVPAAVVDLEVRSFDATSATLRWTAPGDDGGIGEADHYDLRWMSGSLTEETWNGAALVSGLLDPSPSGTEETFVVVGLVQAKSYSLGLRAIDESGNASPLSNVVTVTPAPDTEAPARISDLAIATVDAHSMTLQWTATGNNGSSGRASGYELRYATEEISDATWETAIPVADLPSPAAAGSEERATILDLEINADYYVGVRAIDEAGNRSELSNIVRGTTVPFSLIVSSSDGFSFFSPAWSPLGDEVAVAGSRRTDFSERVFFVSLQERRITSWIEDAASPTWSPDGSRIAFVSDRSRSRGVWSVGTSPGSAAPAVVVSQQGFAINTCAWSPDGSRIAFDRTSCTSQLCGEIALVPVSGGPVIALVERGIDFNHRPQWFPDGSRILFGSWRSGSTQMFVVPSGGGEPSQLTFGPDGNSSGKISPDGTTIAFISNRTGDFELWTMTSGGDDPVQLTFDVPEGRISTPDWSPDGTRLCFVAVNGEIYELWTLELQ